MIAKNKNKLLIPSILLLGAMLFNMSILYANAFEVHEIAPEIMLELTNRSRKENGMPELALDLRLQQASEAKANDMFESQYFDHVSPKGVTPWEFIKSAGYEYVFAGENLAIDFATAEGVQRAFMNSSSHRQNILSSNYSNVGIAVKKGIMKEREATIVVVEFGAPLKKVSIEQTNIGRKDEANKDVSLAMQQVDPLLNENTIIEKSYFETERKSNIIILPSNESNICMFLRNVCRSELNDKILNDKNALALKNKNGIGVVEDDQSGNLYKYIASFDSFEKEIMLILLSFAISMNLYYDSNSKVQNKEE